MVDNFDQRLVEFDIERTKHTLRKASPKEVVESAKAIVANQKTFKVKTGYSQLDIASGGFISKSTYLMGGINKSGKSTLVMNFLDNMMVDGTRVGVMDTELGKEDFIRRFTAVSNNIHEFDESNTKELQDSWCEVFLKTNQLQYCYKDELLSESEFDIKKIIQILDIWCFNGVKVVVIDNITTIQNSISGAKEGYKVLRSFIEKIKDYAVKNNIVLILVLHTKGGDLVQAAFAEKINSILDNNTPHRIFEKSVTVNNRPNKTSLYGGQSIISQVSGVLLFWRPWQDFGNKGYQKMAMLILEDWRFKPKDFTNEIEFEFDFDKSRYLEVEPKQELMVQRKPYKDE